MAKHGVKHIGFKGAVKQAAKRIKPRKRGQTKKEAAAAAIAASTRGASAAAKRRNPRLRRVKGKAKTGRK